ncbi:tyrosine-protein kinase domain-containing protein [Actinomycetospora sp. C-140]
MFQTISEAVQKHRLLALGTLLAITIGVSAWAFLKPPTYTSSVTFYVSAQPTDDPTGTYQGSLLSQQRAISYVELIQSDRLARDVINAAGLPVTPDDLLDRVTATNKVDSVVINVQVDDTSATRSADIANSIGRVFPGIVAEVERPQGAASSPPVAVRVVQPAYIPDTPSSSSPVAVSLLGLVGGLVAAAGVTVLWTAIDTRIKGRPALEKASGVSQIGRIPDGAADNPSVQEAIRQLRTNLEFANLGASGQVTLITSPSPAEGKTTVSCALASAMAASGKRVVLVDADLRRPSIASTLGLEPSVGLTTVLIGRTSLADAVQRLPGRSIDVLTSGPRPPNPSELLGSEQMMEAVDQLRRSHDVVLIDTAPVLPVTDAVTLSRAADSVVLVCRYAATRTTQAAEASRSLMAVQAKLAGAILNMAPQETRQAYSYYVDVDSTTRRDDAFADAPTREDMPRGGANHSKHGVGSPGHPSPRPR